MTDAETPAMKPLVLRFLETNHVRGILFPRRGLYPCCFDSEARFEVMAGLRRAIELAMSEEDLAALRAIARSRTAPASRVERARMLLAYREDASFFAVGRAVGAHHQTVQRCVERALAYGPMAVLDDRPRPGREATITAEAKAWLSTSPAARPRNSAIPTNCGRRGCSPAMRVSMGRQRGTLALPSWLRAQCATSSMSRR